MPADPDRPCAHERFESTVAVVRHTDGEGGPPIAYSADIRAWCSECNEPFRWTGLEVGLMPDRPMVSADGLEMRAPLRPASSDPDFGLGLPGFTVEQAGG